MSDVEKFDIIIVILHIKNKTTKQIQQEDGTK